MGMISTCQAGMCSNMSEHDFICVGFLMTLLGAHHRGVWEIWSDSCSPV